MSGDQEDLRLGIAKERAGELVGAMRAYEAASLSGNRSIQAEALTRLSDVHRERCEWDDAIDAARRAQEIARAGGLSDQLIEAQIAEGNALMTRGKFAAAMQLFEQLAGSAPTPRVRGVALQNIGSMKAQLGRFDEARESFEESLARFEEAGYAKGRVIARNNLGRLALDRGDFAAAAPLLKAAIDEAASIGLSELVALAQVNLAAVSCERGEEEEARSLAYEALGYFAATGSGVRQIECLRLLATLEERRHDIAAATRLYERALTIADQIGSDVEKTVTLHRLRALRPSTDST